MIYNTVFKFFNKKKIAIAEKNILEGLYKSMALVDRCIDFDDFKKAHPFIINTISRTSKLIKIYKLQDNFHISFNFDCLLRMTKAKHTLCLAASINNLLQKNK